MSDPLIDAVALALAAAAQPARAAAQLKAEPPLWPAVPLPAGLARLGLTGPGIVSRWREEAARTVDRAARRGYIALWPAHPEYPSLLAEIVDPPLLLWCDGQVECLRAPCVAIVGSRRATAAGREVAVQIAADLAAAGVVVVSGFALGIDAAAHRGALTRGRTVAVLGCGLDCTYPSVHAGLRHG
jgi:DNA processing protein